MKCTLFGYKLAWLSSMPFNKVYFGVFLLVLVLSAAEWSYAETIVNQSAHSYSQQGHAYEQMTRDLDGQFVLLRKNKDGDYLVVTVGPLGTVSMKPFRQLQRSGFEDPRQLFHITPAKDQSLKICSALNGGALTKSTTIRVHIDADKGRPALLAEGLKHSPPSDNNAKQQWKVHQIGGPSGSSFNICSAKGGEMDGCSRWYLLRMAQIKGRTFVRGAFDGHAVSPNDVPQGMIGSCYFLAALMAVAKQHPDHIVSLFRGDTIQFPGQKKPMKWDGYVPTRWQPQLEEIRPFGTQAVREDTQHGERELWPLMAEKAFAAQQNGYSNIHGGFPGFALETITGNKTKSIYIPFSFKSHERLFQCIREAHHAGSPIVCGTKSSFSDGNPLDLSHGHAYAVLDVSNQKDGKMLLGDPHGPDRWREISSADLRKYFNLISLTLPREKNTIEKTLSSLKLEFVENWDSIREFGLKPLHREAIRQPNLFR